MGALQIIALILKGAEVINTTGPISIQTALALKEIFSKSGTEYSVEIQAYQDGALLAADATLDMVAQWKKENGYE